MKNIIRSSVLLVVILVITLNAFAQSYDIVIKAGHVIDPKNSIDAIMDVAIKDGKVVQVANNIDSKQAAQVVDARGLLAPGFSL